MKFTEEYLKETAPFTDNRVSLRRLQRTEEGQKKNLQQNCGEHCCISKETNNVEVKALASYFSPSSETSVILRL